MARRCGDVKALIKEAIESQDLAFLAELNAELVAIENEIGDLETRKMLSGEMDPQTAFYRKLRCRRNRGMRLGANALTHV